ncbi:MAG: hypothetical protein WAO61_01100 [Solirubrobacterales bacterium]
MDPIVWIAIASVLIVLFVIAGSFLSADLVRGALGGHMTLERANKLLVISTDDATRERAAAWVTRYSEQFPVADFVELHVPGEQEFKVFELFQLELLAQKPDAVVWSLHDQQHGSHEGPYAMAKRELSVPLDAIYTSGETTEQKERAAK